ncbi:MAG: flagellar biosynthesis regulator FlaF [Marinicaulis sp.]|nr:flagellar biosynthesis regulator FlaF [Marinicaulis sp.]NNE39395.1 flagellar biosynthesis regulator FlaF [Marinicaulis sp.]NNL87902.1 flagellar biosynthesis regulator FlaF [Marinicaulis sp.]
MSHEAYANTMKQSADPRDTEYRAFAHATKGLIEAGEYGHENLKLLAAALHANKTLWGTLANDCASDANCLPEELRARIIGLSRWVQSYSSDIMRKRESLDPLIDINRIMMDGLAGKSVQPE